MKAAKSGATPAYFAARGGHTAALELLVKSGCDVNKATKIGSTPAFVARFTSQPALMRRLSTAVWPLEADKWRGCRISTIVVPKQSVSRENLRPAFHGSKKPPSGEAQRN